MTTQTTTTGTPRKMGRPPLNRFCSLSGCGRKHKAGGFCRKHYDARYRPAYRKQHAAQERERGKKWERENPEKAKECKRRYYLARRAADLCAPRVTTPEEASPARDEKAKDLFS